MSPTPLSALVIADESIAGVAERVAALPDDDEAAAELLRTGLAADGISPPEVRSVSDLARRIVVRLRGRRLLEDLGEADAVVELLGLHVPPAGRAALTLRRSAATDRQVSIKAMGFGFGDGRRLAIAIDEDIPERDACMQVIQHVFVHVRRFATAAEPLVTTDVLAWGGREMVAFPNCPYCGVRDDLNPLEFEEETADALDLRAYDAPVTRETSFSLEGSRKADVGIDLPVPGGGKVAAGFQFEQQTSITCSAKYTFPAGHWFVPYRRLGERAVLPYWVTR